MMQVLGALLAAALLVAPAFQAQGPPLADVLARAGAYAAEYARTLPVLVADERAEDVLLGLGVRSNDTPGAEVARPEIRLMRGTIVIEATGADTGWQAVRDIYEVNTQSLHRKGRLEQLFRERSPEGAAEIAEIAEASRRQYVGSSPRTFNVPTFALMFLLPQNQSRFAFRRIGEKKADGETVWVVAYDETRRPVMVRTTAGEEYPIHGELWIEPNAGRLVKSTMILENASFGKGSSGGIAAAYRPRITIEVTYRKDPTLNAWVPLEMRESYVGAPERVTCTAKYSNFRVITSAAAQPPVSAQVATTSPSRRDSTDTSSPLPSMWSSVDIPGSIDDLRRAAGILIPVERTRLALEIARLAYSVAEGKDTKVDRARTAAQALATLGLRGLATPRTRVPLPLPREAWLEVVPGGGVSPRDLGAVILGDAQAALLYHGLFALDDETLQYLADTKNGTLRACLSNVHVFSTFGRSFRIRGGRVQVPGGAAAAALWEELAGQTTTNPSGFAAALFSGSRGWLAYFYDTLAHLDGPHLAFALGSSTASDRQTRVSRFKALFASVAGSDPNWVPTDRPFARPMYDLALLFSRVRLGPDGRFAQPASRRFWKVAFEGGIVPDAAGALMEPGADDDVDAAYLAEQVLAQPPDTRQERFEMVLFGQRLAGGRSEFEPAAATEPGRTGQRDEVDDDIRAIQGLRRYRALVLTLDRIGVRPSVHRAAVGAAGAMSSMAGRDERARATVQFQSAVALVDRLVQRHAITRATAAAAVMSLARLTPTAGPSAPATYNGAVGRWLASLLATLPKPWRPGLDPTSAEDILLSALAGPPEPAGGTLSQMRIAWEGQTYRVDLGAAEFARLRRARQALGGGEIDLALDLALLASGHDADRRVLQTTTSRALERLERWRPAGAAGLAPGKPEDLRRTLRELQDRLAAGDAQKSRSALDRMGSWADAILADTLASFVYAIHIGEPDPVLGSPDLAARHSLNYEATPFVERASGAWSVPSEVRGGGQAWHVVGSLLALDVPLARLSLHRISTEPRTAAPTLARNDAFTLTHTVVLLDPYAMTDDHQAAIAAAIERGRALVSQVVRDRDDAGALGVAGAARLSEWRTNGFRRALADEPDAASTWFSLTELMRLGNPGLSSTELDRWGVSIYGLAGELACSFPPPAPWEDLAGRVAGGLMTTGLPDLGLCLAQWLHRLQLPAALLPALMTRATQDLLDEAQPSDAHDGTAIARAAASVTRTRFEDYVSTLTTEGPLVPWSPSTIGTHSATRL